MITLRYRADSRITYARALWALCVHAHDNRDAFFDFGPLQLEALRDQGLTVTGRDLDTVRAILEKVPGLHLSDE